MAPGVLVLLASNPAAPAAEPFSEIAWTRLGLLAALVILGWEILKAVVPEAAKGLFSWARRWVSGRADKAAQERAVRDFTAETLGTNWLSCLPSVSRLVGDAPPLKEIYQPPAFSFASRDRQLASASLAEVLGLAGSLAVVGAPGCGKSTLLAMLALAYARDTVEEELRLRESRLPVFLALARLPAELGPLPEVAAAALRRAGCEVEAPFLRDQLKARRTIVLLDGLDEAVEPARQAELARWIHDAISAFPGNRFVVTCRTTEWNAMRVPGLPEARILPFAVPERALLVERWTRLLAARGLETPAVIAARAAGLRYILAAPRDAHLATLAGNPFLLTLMIVLHLAGVEVPDRRSRLYDALVRAMLGEWDLVKGVRAALAPEAIEAKVAFFQRVALHLAERPEQGDGIHLEDGELGEVLDRAARETAGECGRAAPLLAGALRAGFLAEREPRVLAFANRGILEFLAARELVRLRRAEAAVRHVGEPAWREILLQLVEQTPDLPALLGLLMDGPGLRNSAFFEVLAHVLLEAGARGLPAAGAREALERHLVESAARGAIPRELARVSWRALDESWRQRIAAAAAGKDPVVPVAVALHLLADVDDAGSIAMVRSALGESPEIGPQGAEALLEATSMDALALLWELAEREESAAAAVSSLAARGEAALPGARAAVADASPVRDPPPRGGRRPRYGCSPPCRAPRRSRPCSTSPAAAPRSSTWTSSRPCTRPTSPATVWTRPVRSSTGCSAGRGSTPGTSRESSTCW